MIEEVINDLIARMYEVQDGWEYMCEDSNGICFKSLNGSPAEMHFSDWDEVSEFVLKHQN